MNFEDDILKGKHFPIEDQDRLKATKINLLLLLAIILLALDLAESIGRGYRTMSIIEISTISILLMSYLLFPKMLSLPQAIYISLASLTLFILTSLSIEDVNPELSLFWLSMLPIPYFYFLGVDKGIKWSLVVFSILVFITIASFAGWFNVLFSGTLMAQITIGYFAIAYWVYLTEKERTAYADNLSTALMGQEVLFKEVHHRTKNNMQVIMGLLETQSFKVDNAHYKKMFQMHVERIKAMSMVHENLYKNDNYEKVDMSKYLNDLSDSLQSLTPYTIVTEIDFVYLDIKTSMNLGLIFNEAVSNAIEHAYSGAGEGYIDVSLRRTGSDCVLRVKDYGKGFNTEKEHQTLGMTLIEDLSLSLPKGSMKVDVSDGTEIKVYFSIEEEK